MKRNFVFCGLLLSFFLVLPDGVRATVRIGLTETDWIFKPAILVPNQPETIYLQVRNYGDEDVEGFLQIADNGFGLGLERPFSSRAGGAVEEVWFRWIPATGRHELTISATDQFHQPLSFVAIPHVVTVIADNDGDGVADEQDPDDDNDGMTDIYEITYVLNPLSYQDRDLDPDNDGLANLREFFLGTDPHKSDTDSDGVLDGQDPAPRDPNIPAKPKPVVVASVTAGGSGGGVGGGTSGIVTSTQKSSIKASHPGGQKPIGSRTVDSIVPPPARLQNDTVSSLTPTSVLPLTGEGGNGFLPSASRGEPEGGKNIVKESWFAEHGLDALGILLGVIVIFGTGFWIFKAKQQTE